MWQLYAIIMVWSGTSSIGGPVIVDGFATEAACLTHLSKLKENTPQSIDHGKWLPEGRARFVHEKCIHVDKK